MADGTVTIKFKFDEEVLDDFQNMTGFDLIREFEDHLFSFRKEYRYGTHKADMTVRRAPQSIPFDHDRNYQLTCVKTYLGRNES